MDTYDEGLLRQLHTACLQATSSVAKGAALEDLVEYVFTHIPSVRLYQRDIKDESGAQEVDLVFSHFHFLSMLPIPDVTIITECKNERRRTSAGQVREFGNKLRTRSMTIGVLVTSAGLSGPRGRAAHSAIRDELSNGVSIVVVTARELAALSTPDELVDLLCGRINELRTFRGYRTL